ncbi:MAG: hypothetical protein C0620_07030 [Desulfuromonas sp.]|nr:MAG: hypothetical protein C0620_07030 [Desulfuromonas sp.]
MIEGEMLPVSKSAENRYLAFISYRHADNAQQGRQWATWLHQAIETYEVPEDLVGTLNQRGEEIPARIYPVFRDEQELPAYADLGSAIVHALDASQMLVVLCSPRAFQSTYVADEIDYFKRLGRSDAIMAAIIDGEPNVSWDQSKYASGWTEQDECFPEPLLYEYDEAGQRTQRHAEPIAADFRVLEEGRLVQGWTSPQAYRMHLQHTTSLNKSIINERVAAYSEQLDLMVLKIIAGILSIPLRVLTQRDKEYQLVQERRRSRRLRQWLAAIALLAIIAVLAGIVAFQQRREARLQRDQVLVSQSRFLTDQARQANDNNQYDTALLLGLHALPGEYGGERPAWADQHELRRAVAKSQKLMQFHHDGVVNCVAYRPDGAVVVSGGEDGQAIVRSNQSGERRYALHHDNGVVDVAFSPDGQRLATVAGGMIYLWSADTGEPLPFQSAGYFTTVSFSPDGSMLLARSLDEAVVWSLASGEVLYHLGHDNFVQQCCFSPDSRWVATASFDQTAALWSMSDGSRQQVLSHQSPVNSVSFSPDCTRVVTASHDRTAVIWSVESGASLQVLHHDNAVMQALFYPDNQTVVTTGNEEGLFFWSAQTGRELFHTGIDMGFAQQVVIGKTGRYLAIRPAGSEVKLLSLAQALSVTLAQSGEIRDLVISPDETTVLTASADGTAALWAVKNGEHRSLSRHQAPVNQVAVSADGHWLASVADDATLRLSALSTADSPQQVALSDRGSMVGFNADATQLVTVTDDHTITLWSVATGQEMQSFACDAAVTSVAFSHDGHYLAVVTRDPEVLVWPVSGGDPLLLLPCDRQVNSACFNADGTRLITAADDGTVVSWEVASGRAVWTWQNDHPVIKAVVFNIGQQIVAAASNGRVVVLAERDGAVVHSWQQSAGVEQMIVGGDGQLLVTVDEDSALAVRSLPQGALLWRIAGSDRIDALSLSDDGTLLAVSSGWRHVIVYQVADGGVFYAPDVTSTVSSLCFTPDSQCLVTGTRDNAVAVWPLYRDNLQTVAKEKLPVHRLHLTVAERQRYYLPSTSAD